jgi:hypothetical protein
LRTLLITLLVTSLLFNSAFSFTGKKPLTNSEAWGKRSERSEKWFFEDLPHHNGQDIKESFWNKKHLLFLAIGAGTTALVHEADPKIQRKFHPKRPMGNTLDNIMHYGAHPLVLGGATLMAFGISKGIGAEKAAITAGTLLEALVLTEAITVSLQLVTRRERPDGSNSRSFPSGHASGAFALATVTEVLYGPWIGIPSYALASLVGVSRIDKNKHVASDVIAGAVLGTLIGLGTAKFHKKEFSDYFLVPHVGESSAGISLIHVF